jgi:hypothetical protein
MTAAALETAADAGANESLGCRACWLDYLDQRCLPLVAPSVYQDTLGEVSKPEDEDIGRSNDLTHPLEIDQYTVIAVHLKSSSVFAPKGEARPIYLLVGSQTDTSPIRANSSVQSFGRCIASLRLAAEIRVAQDCRLVVLVWRCHLLAPADADG